jgi:arginine-tRNA-protein transferase
MKHSLPLVPQFYVTAPQPCPYLEDKIERKLFTGLNNDNGEALNNTLSSQGFRRSQNVLYRPACVGCSACISARIRVEDFKLTKSQKRILNKNSNLFRGYHSALATDEQYELFNKYLNTRHSNGGMSEMTVFEYSSMLEETPVNTKIVEYHSKTQNGRHSLDCVSLTDVLNDGLSMVYSFFNPDLSKLSLGKFMILDHINIVANMGLKYLYLGYWVPGSGKMDYKSKFSALELYIDGEWQFVDDINKINCESFNGSDQSITEQVSLLALPTK